MGAATLSSRAVIGEFYRQLEQLDGLGWASLISVLFQSDQSSETYPWLGQSPVMREWIGGRHAKGFTENGITIENKHFEASIEVLVRDMRRDKTGQVMTRIRELAGRTDSHWARLLSTLIMNGESTVCYDGQYFFDTDHAEGESGTQSNDLSIDISALPVTNHGSTTSPSVGEMRDVILQLVQAIYGFKDDQGEPMNETASEFLIMVPTTLLAVTQSAIVLPMVDNGESNVIPATSTFRLRAASNPRLTWTDKIAAFRADGDVSPFIRQEETRVDLKVKAEGSEFEFDNDAHQYGVDTWRNAGYGHWQLACLGTMV